MRVTARVFIVAAMVAGFSPAMGRGAEAGAEAPPTTAASAPSGAGNWPAWRGAGSGVAAAGNLPVFWDARTNVAWKTPVPGEGNSSPIVWGNRIFLTAWEAGGKGRLVLCYDASSGREVWRQSYEVAKPAETYPKNGYASATPVADGVRVYVFFDDPGLVALSAATGEKLWTRPLGPFANGWNLAASPALSGQAVIVACDHDKKSFVLAADAATGREMWRTQRKLGRQYATPIVFRHGGRQQVVVNGQQVISYDPADGRELWRCAGMMQVCVPSAVYAGGLVWVGSGRNGPAMAIDPSGSGDVTETHVRMQVPVGGPYVPSPLVLPAGLMMLPGDNGKVRLIAADGHVAAECRVEGHFSASPAFGDGRIYWSNEAGDTYVLGVTGRPGGASDGATRLDVLAVNSLGERILASPALVEGRVYLRTAGQLYCLAGRARPASAAAQDKLPTDFASLKKLYEAHQGDQKGEVEHPDVALRLAVVREMGIHKDPAAVEFLKTVAEKDQHWDVSEEAVKVLCTYERAALKQMIELLESTNWRGYLKVSPAETVGRLQAAAAAPALLKLARDGDRLNRIAALSALARIADGHDQLVPDASSALLAGLKDKEGVVQKAALEGLALLAEKLGPGRPAALAAVKALADSPNPIVGQAAQSAAARLAETPKAR